jgi:hypothetical protein
VSQRGHSALPGRLGVGAELGPWALRLDMRDVPILALPGGFGCIPLGTNMKVQGSMCEVGVRPSPVDGLPPPDEGSGSSFFMC